MKVYLPKKQLAESLGHVERIIPYRSSNPSLSLVTLSIADGEMILAGSNMDIDIEAKISADVEGSGTAALPAQVFAQVVRSLPGELVELTFAEELEIRSGSYDTKMQLAEPAAGLVLSFPEHYRASFPAATLRRALESVRYAAAVAEYQAIFRGIKVEFGDVATRAVATDGFRLAYYHIDEASGLAGEVVIPARSADEMVRILDRETVEFELAQNQLSLRSGPYRLNVKLMEGDFPDYRRVIPKQFLLALTLEARDLAEAVTRVAVMADRTSNNRVDLFIGGGTLQITAEGGYGRAQESLEVLQEGEASQLAVAYNAKYLVDALQPMSGQLRLSLSGTTSPSVLTSLADPSYLAMVVPLRTG